MKIEQAIGILSSRNETNRLFCENLSADKSEWSDYDKFIDSDTQAVNIALTALKEKQERGKGCEYCNPDNVAYYNRGNIPHFCKHCGRDLEESK